jgi:mono/diheme cytochrome c family protein
MSHLIWLVILLILATLLVRLVFRARRITNRWLKWGGVGLAAAAAAVAFGMSGLAMAGMVKARSRSAPVPDVKVAATPEMIRRGQAIADSMCGSCHSEYAPMAGGLEVGKLLPVPIGSFVSSNLTPTGALPNWSDGQIFRAIRNGVDAQGNWLVIMSYTNVGKLSDADTEALIAFLRSRTGAGSRTVDPPDHFNLLGLVMLGAGMLPTGSAINASVVSAPPKAPTVEYGEYILSYQDCRKCHGDNLKGGVPGQLGPIGPSLDFVRTWKREGFIATMRTGVDPGGHQITGPMPWRDLGKMDDEELTAVYAYLTRREPLNP